VAGHFDRLRWRLLQAQGLPASDITDEHLEHFFFVDSDGSPAGLVGLELYVHVSVKDLAASIRFYQTLLVPSLR